MSAWAILPPRWFVRPRLILAGAAGAVLLSAADSDRQEMHVMDAAGAVVIAQASGVDPTRRERAGAAALATVRARPEVTSASLVPPDKLLDWLRQAGIARIADRLAMPPTIELRLVRAADRAGIVARLKDMPGIFVAPSGAADPPVRSRWLLFALGSATLLVLAAGVETRALGSAMAVLRQVGATPVQRIAMLLISVAGSAGAGALIGGIISSTRQHWPWTALLWLVPAVSALLVAALLPALRIAPARRP